jgi:serine/threonine-protein kinase
LPPHEAATYIYHACEAVAEAHSLGIVHRDLKPANLFLTQRPNGTPCVKVLDFGISKELDPSQRVGPDLTKTGTVVGSPSYMSPEQLANFKETDARGDIWSLGVILFQLLTGTVPFAADTLMEIITRIVTRPPPRPTQLRPGLPPQLEAIVLKCLEKPREQRFQSVPDLMTALHSFIMRDSALITLGIGAQTGPGELTGAGAQTAQQWTGASTTGRARGNASSAAGLAVAAAVVIALLIGGGAWLTWGRRSSGANSVAAADPTAPVAAPSVSAVAPTIVEAPANTALETGVPKPGGEPPAPTVIPSASGPAPVNPEPTDPQTKTSHPEGTTAPSRRTTPTAPKPSSTKKTIPDFNE